LLRGFYLPLKFYGCSKAIISHPRKPRECRRRASTHTSRVWRKSVFAGARANGKEVLLFPGTSTLPLDCISALKCVPYKISSCEGTTDVVLRPTWCRCHGAGAPPEGGSAPRVSILGILAARCLVSPLRRAADACLAFAAAPRIAQLMWCCCVQSSWSGCMVRARSQVTCASLACECCAPSAANLSDEDAFTGAG